MVGERKRGTACPGRRQFRCGGDDRPESALSAKPHRAQNRAADRAFAFESCGGFRAALLRLRRDVANHSTGHSRRGGVLGVGALGEAAGLFFRGRVYRAREPSQASTTCPSNYLASRSIRNVAREQRQSAWRVPGAKKALAGVASEPALPAPPLVFLNGGFGPFVQPRDKPFLAESVAKQERITDEQARAAVRPFQFSGQIWSTKRSTIPAE